MTNVSELCLTVSLVGGDDTAAAAQRAAVIAALNAATAASVIIDAALSNGGATPAVKALVDLLQKRGVAALIADDSSLARIVKADGIHVSWSKDQVEKYKLARAELGQHAIIGVDAGRSRHDAMELGEAGADYIYFGIPPHVDDRDTARRRQLELVAWWSVIFEIPCVAGDVMTIEHAQALADAGADFVSLQLGIETDAAITAELVKGAAAAMVARKVTV